MTLIHFLPEIMITASIFVTLILMSFGVPGQAWIAPSVSAGSLIGLIYFFSRPDLADFVSPTPLMVSDSLSYFGRLLALLALSVFTIGFHFQRTLSVKEKQRATLFIQFLALFICGLFLSQGLLLFFGSALGIYFCGVQLVLVESKNEPSWILWFRQKAIHFGLWLILGFGLFLLSTHFFRSIYFEDWISTLKSESVSEWGLWSLTVMILLLGWLPLIGNRFSGKAPLGLAILNFSMMLAMQVYWFRVGVPFLVASKVFSVPVSQVMLSIVFGVLTLRSVFYLVRTRDHHAWISAVYPVLTGMSLFAVVLPSGQGLEAFFLIALALLLTFSLSAHAFHDSEYHQKGLVLVSLIALLGAPPLVLGERFYLLIHDLVEGGNLAAGILMVLVWYGLIQGSIQFIGKVLLTRNPPTAQRDPYLSEGFFLALYFIGVIGLTAFQHHLFTLLYGHPVLNLW